MGHYVEASSFEGERTAEMIITEPKLMAREVTAGRCLTPQSARERGMEIRSRAVMTE